MNFNVITVTVTYMVELQDRVLAPLGPLSIFAVAEIVVTAQQQPQPQQQNNHNCSWVETK